MDRRYLLIFLLFSLLYLSCASPGPTPTLLIRGAEVYTDGSSQLQQLDILISGETIIDLGRNLPVPPGCATMDLEGAYVYPGLVDAHLHLAGIGKALGELDLNGIPSYEELCRAAREHAAGLGEGEWLSGRGWDQNLWPGRNLPEHGLLSESIPERPVYLKRTDGHAALVNRTAMDLAGIDQHTPDPPGGEILKDVNGMPSGILVDRAMELVSNLLQEPSLDERVAHIERAQNLCASLGLTSIHDAGVDQEILAAYLLLEKLDQLKLNVNLMLDDSEELLQEWFLRGPYNSPRVRVQTVKLYADGALGSRGAWLREPYSDRPGYSGLQVTELERIRDVCRRARDAGFQVATHCIGDRAVSEVVEIYRDLLSGEERSRRWRIEHVQVIEPGILPHFVSSGTVASMQPYHYISDLPWAPDRIGKRMDHAYAWKVFKNASIPLCFGSDAPVESPDPLSGFNAALQGPHALEPGPILSAYTAGAHYASFRESSRGRIAAGFFADLSVFSKDIYRDREAECLLTVVNGKITYKCER